MAERRTGAWDEVVQLTHGGSHIRVSFTGLVVRGPEEVEPLLAGVQALWGRPGRLPLLVDGRRVPWTSKPVRDRLSQRLAEVVRATAVVVESPLSRMLMSAFMVLNRHGMEIRLFGTEAAALAWLEVRRDAVGQRSEPPTG